uniref:SH3 domain-containing protein n=1 Tax=Steinernema glaseri TaxID=37863 RepID=A0A1I7ZXT9_9BILA
MRWGSLKSRSYDHAGDRRAGPREPGQPGQAPLPPGRYTTCPEYEYYSSLDRRDHSLPPQSEAYHPREPPPVRGYYDRGDDGYESGYRVPPSARYGPPRHYHSFTSTRDRDYLSAYRDTRSARDPYEAREHPSLRRDYGQYPARMLPPDDYRGGGEYPSAREPYGTTRRPRGLPEYGRDYGRERDERDMVEPPREPRRYPGEVPYQDDRRGQPSQRPLDYRREEDSGPSDYDRGPQPGGPPGVHPVPPALKGQPPPQQQQPLYQDQQHTGLADDRYAKQNGGDQVVRQMVAKFSYSSYLSPNVDADQVELQFREGDIITIFGEIDEDGFYYGELNGQRGLVPSNFLSPLEQPRGEMMYPPPVPRQQPMVPQQQQQQQMQQMQMAMTGSQTQQQSSLDQNAPRPRGVAFTDTAPTVKRPVPARQASQTSSKGGTAAPTTSASVSKLKSGSSTASSAGTTKPATKKADASKATANNRKSSQAIKKTDSQLKKK